MDLRVPNFCNQWPDQGNSTLFRDPKTIPSNDVVRSAVSSFEGSGGAHAAYGIDFGVLVNGETALVEVNDGFALGSYGLNRSVYADLILTRWKELITNIEVAER